MQPGARADTRRTLRWDLHHLRRDFGDPTPRDRARDLRRAHPL